MVILSMAAKCDYFTGCVTIISLLLTGHIWYTCNGIVLERVEVVRKSLLAGVSLFMALLLSSCGGTEAAPSVEERGQQNRQLSAGEVIQKVSDTFNQLNSYAIKSEAQQELERTISGEAQIMKSKTTSEIQWVKPSPRYYLQGEVHTEGMPPVSIEQYFISGQGTFSKFDGREWMKVSDATEADAVMNNPESPEYLLKMLEQFKENVIFDDGIEGYTMTLELPEEGLMQISEMVNAGLNAQSVSVGFNFTYTKMKATLRAEKDSFLLYEMTVEQEQKIDSDEGGVIQRKTDHSTFSNYNGIAELAVPAEVIEAAK